MAFAHDVLPHIRRRSARASVRAGFPRFRKTADDRLAECEFGEVGRDPRYPSGWFILPALVIGIAILGFLL